MPTADRGPHKLWDEIIEGRFHPAIDATTEALLLDLHRRAVELERKTKGGEER